MRNHPSHRLHSKTGGVCTPSTIGTHGEKHAQVYTSSDAMLRWTLTFCCSLIVAVWKWDILKYIILYKYWYLVIYLHQLVFVKIATVSNFLISLRKLCKNHISWLVLINNKNQKYEKNSKNGESRMGGGEGAECDFGIRKDWPPLVDTGIIIYTRSEPPIASNVR